MSTSAVRTTTHLPIRLLELSSWLALGCAVLLAITALFCHWAVNAEPLGSRDLGLALSLSFIGAGALIASTYAAPALALLGVVTLFLQRHAALRFLAAAAASALPIAVLTCLGPGSP